MEYRDIPINQPRSIRLLSYDGPSGGNGSLKLTLKPTTYEIGTIFKGDDTITVHQEQLALQTPFYALSYVWGDPSDTQPIYCNNQQIQITRNLYYALVQLFAENPSMLLWVDALCINQSDVSEKGNHVAMMGDVYHAAESVIIWLGSGEGLSTIAFQSTIENFIQIRSRFPLGKAYPACSRCKWTLFEDFHCEETKHVETAKQCPGLRELTRHMNDSEWFGRMWTYQELKLAKSATVRLGPYSLGWQYFVLASEEFNRSHGCVVRAISSLYLLNDNIKQPIGSEKFVNLLCATQRRKASVPQDRIFGLMGIPTQVRMPLKVDYNVPLEKLYTAVTRFCVNDENNPGILDSINHPRGMQSGRRHDRIAGLPSWAVDLSTGHHITGGGSTLEFGRLPSLPSSASSLSMYCFVLGFFTPGDERTVQFNNSKAPDFRPLPPCVIGALSSDTKSAAPRFTISQPKWMTSWIGNIDNVGNLYDHYNSSADLLNQLDIHLQEKCSCMTETKTRFKLWPSRKADVIAKPVEAKLSELACILVNQNGHAACNCFGVESTASGNFELSSLVNWPVSWPHGFHSVPEKQRKARGKTLHEYSLVFTSVQLF